MKLFATIAAISTLVLIAGCDFHEDPPPLEGDYQSTRLLAGFGRATADLLAAGGLIEMTLRDTEDGRRVSAHVIIPNGAILPDHQEIDTTLSGSYSRIVDRVTLDFEGEAIGLPARWLYRDGRLTATGRMSGIANVPVEVEIELVRK